MTVEERLVQGFRVEPGLFGVPVLAGCPPSRESQLEILGRPPLRRALRRKTARRLPQVGMLDSASCTL